LRSFLDNDLVLTDEKTEETFPSGLQHATKPCSIFIAGFLTDVSPERLSK